MKMFNLRTALATGALLLVTACAPAAPSSPETAETPPTDGTPTTEGTIPSQDTDIGKVTEDIWVEMYAQEIYHSSPELSPAWDATGGGRDQILQQYGVTTEQLSNYAQQINGDYDRASALINKANSRLMELQGGE